MPGLEIEISDEEFLKKPSAERDLITFKTQAALQRDIRRIDEQGCKMSKIKRNNEKKNNKKKFVLSIGGISVGIAALVELIKSFFE